MKLAFSTLGCPEWSWNEIFATAKDMGMDGIEIRGIEKQIYVPRIKAFSEENLPGVLEQLKSAGMSIPCFTSSASLGLEKGEEASMEESRDYIDFAQKAGVPYVRVMIVPVPEPVAADFDRAQKNYRELCQYAKGKNVRVLIETNGTLSKSAEMARFLEGADPETRGVLWDIHHPYRYYGETPAYTWSVLGDEIRHVHVKDSVLAGGKVEYRMMGYGDVPIFDALKVLEDAGYNGFVTLEWVKRWNPDLQEPGIVFYHFHSYMSALLQQLEPDKASN